MNFNHYSMDFPQNSNPSSTQLQNLMPMSIPPSMFHQYNQSVKENQALRLLWNQQMFEIYHCADLRSHHPLPHARIKRIMKADEDVKMVSAEAPALFSKACELFILELTLRAWMQTEECNRRILQRCDIGRAIRQADLFDFLVDVVPLEHDHYYDQDPKPEEEAGKNIERTTDVDAGKNVEGTTELGAAAGVMMVMNYENELDEAGNQLDQDSQSYMINQEVAQPCMIQTPFLPFAQNQYNIYPK